MSRRKQILASFAAAFVMILGMAWFINRTPEPKNDFEAARIAAACFQWPERAVQKVELREIQMRTPMLLVFERAKMVTVSESGRCGEIIPTRVDTPVPVSNLGMSSVFVIDDGSASEQGTYIIVMMSGRPGERSFLGMKGGAMEVEIEKDLPQPAAPSPPAEVPAAPSTPIRVT